MLLPALGSTIVCSLEGPIGLMVSLNFSITPGFTSASLPAGTETWLQPAQMPPNLLLLPQGWHREHFGGPMQPCQSTQTPNIPRVAGQTVCRARPTVRGSLEGQPPTPEAPLPLTHRPPAAGSPPIPTASTLSRHGTSSPQSCPQDRLCLSPSCGTGALPAPQLGCLPLGVTPWTRNYPGLQPPKSPRFSPCSCSSFLQSIIRAPKP